MATILNTPGHVALDRIDVWFQDEARFGQQNTTTRIWAEKGTRPRAVKQQQFESAYLYGAVCPATGATQAIIAPHANSEYMNEHLKLISAATAFGRHALVIMDGAGWHQQDLADDFDNLTLLKLPPYSPELNPIEQVWQWLRQNVLANRCFRHSAPKFCNFQCLTAIGHSDLLLSFAGNSSWPLPLSLSVTSITLAWSPHSAKNWGLPA
ncbi:hypothetical protein NUITMVS2_14110 [Shewanella xiamenensis]|nr:hypothetical protein NUITMVS2_14110 [Shewanella xiamenensis]